MEINPQYVNLQGTELVLMTKQEYSHIQELLEDLEDLQTLRKAKAEENPSERTSLEDFIKNEGIEL